MDFRSLCQIAGFTGKHSETVDTPTVIARMGMTLFRRDLAGNDSFGRHWPQCLRLIAAMVA